MVLGRAGLGKDKIATIASVQPLEDIPPRVLSVALVGRVRNPTATVDSVVVAAAAGVAQVQVVVTAGDTRAAEFARRKTVNMSFLAKLGTVAAAAALTRAGTQRPSPVGERLVPPELLGRNRACMATLRLS
mgnify:CR=1 FL=1